MGQNIKLQKKLHDQIWNPNLMYSTAQLSATLTIALECFLCLCEAVIESHLCMSDSVQFIKLDENHFKF